MKINDFKKNNVQEMKKYHCMPFQKELCNATYLASKEGLFSLKARLSQEEGFKCDLSPGRSMVLGLSVSNFA